MPADSFSRRTFPRLTIWCLRQKNCSADIFSELDSWVFQFGGEKSSADNFRMEHLSYFDSFDFRRKNNCSADIFSQLDGLVFHLGGDFYRQTISNSTRQSILRTKILNKNITTEINAGANKNYMSSLAAEGVRNVVLASALYRQTVCRSEFQPCI